MLWHRAEGPVPKEQENIAQGVRVVVINAANRPPRDPSGRIITPPAPGNGIPPNGNGEPT